MENGTQSNSPAGNDLFAVVNNYFLLFFCISCVISSLFIQQLFMTVGQYRAGIGVSSLFGIVLPVALMMRRFPGGFTGQMRIYKPRIHRLILVIVATCATVVLVDQIYVINQHFTPVPEEYAEQIRELKPTSAWQLVITAIGLCVLVPLAEEMVFRGMIQRIFSRNMWPVLAVLLSGAVFGAVHLNAHLLISITCFGWFLGFLFEATDNLIYSMVAHAIFNTVALVQLTTDASVESGNLPVYLRDVWMVVVALVLFIFLVRKIREGGSEALPVPETSPAEPVAD
ncbi:MAG TPA: type II CAAX endopeptidase family protein [Candidatus Krumholzibacteria bacterium]|nr:type II CAAX endopeptidase family protein [Candidatus Krumholzibacteria bacterium]